MIGSGDFAFMLERRPGCYLILGNGDGAGSCMMHNQATTSTMPPWKTGAAFRSLLIERFLA